jgi:hypothetical protein
MEEAVSPSHEVAIREIVKCERGSGLLVLKEI